MNRSVVSIHRLAEQMGLTSRTLRHWESEGLFKSERDTSSGWRVYDEHALSCIRITAILRKIDIPIKDIKSVIANPSLAQLRKVIENKIAEVKQRNAEVVSFQQQLDQVLKFFKQQPEDGFLNLDRILNEMEDIWMSSLQENSLIKIITLPPMRVAYSIAVGTSPEDEAMGPVLEWIKSSNLLSTARFFGGNVKPMPTRTGTPYGYGMCATIPDGISVPEHLKEMVLPGGLFALLASSEDVSLSWKTLMNELAKDKRYKSDQSRLCLEEHIRNDRPDGCGNEYYLNLLEPVKAV